LAFANGAIANDTQIIVFYNVQSGASTHDIVSNVDEFSKIVTIELESLVQDACTGVESPAIIIIPKAKLDGKISMSTGAASEPAVMNISFEALKKSCISKNLWELIIYDDSELS